MWLGAILRIFLDVRVWVEKRRVEGGSSGGEIFVFCECIG